VAYASSLEQVGPMATTAADAALLLSVIAGADERDATCSATPVPDYKGDLGGDLSGVRIGVCAVHFADGLNPGVASAVRSAIGMMVERGAVEVPVSLPHMKYATACYYVIATAEASSNLARFDGVRYGRRARDVTNVHDLYSVSRGTLLGAEVRRRLMLGTYALSSGYYEAYYAKALAVRTLVTQDYQIAFENVDVIASPVAPTTAFPVGEKSEDPLSMYLGDVYTVAANLAGLCAVSLPVGCDSAGLPVGLQLQAAPFQEQALLNAAHGFQHATEFHHQSPPSVEAA